MDYKELSIRMIKEVDKSDDKFKSDTESSIGNNFCERTSGSVKTLMLMAFK